jgi:hypothetical protein
LTERNCFWSVRARFEAPAEAKATGLEDYGVGVQLLDTSNVDRMPDDVERRAA